MKKTKYIMSGGLAFSEQKDMEKLSTFSRKGWHVKNFSFLGYTLEQGEPASYIYSIDYRTVENDLDEYYELCANAGWSLVDSQGDFHLFRAKPNTMPLYTDEETTAEKYKNSAKSMHIATIAVIPATIISWLLAHNTTGTMHMTFLVIATLFTVVAIPTIWTAVTATGNQWKAENKKGCVFLTKLVPLLVTIIAIFALFMSDLKALNIIGAAIIGAFVSVSSMKAIMSLTNLAKSKKTV